SRGGGGQRVVVRAVVPALHVRPAVLGESGSVSGGLLGGWGGLEVRGDRVGGAEVVAGAGDLVGGDGHGGCSFGVVCAGLWVTGQVCSGRAVVITGVPEPGQGLPGGPWRRRRPSRVMRCCTVQWGQRARFWGRGLGL